MLCVFTGTARQKHLCYHDTTVGLVGRSDPVKSGSLWSSGPGIDLFFPKVSSYLLTQLSSLTKLEGTCLEGSQLQVSADFPVSLQLLTRLPSTCEDPLKHFQGQDRVISDITFTFFTLFWILLQLIGVFLAATLLCHFATLNKCNNLFNPFSVNTFFPFSVNSFQRGFCPLFPTKQWVL